MTDRDPLPTAEQPRIVNLGGSVYAIEDEKGRLGQVQLDWDGGWVAYRQNEDGYLGPLGGSLDAKRGGYSHRTRKDAIAHLRRMTRG